MILTLGMFKSCSNHSGWSVVRRTRDSGDNGVCSFILTGCERPRLRVPFPDLPLSPPRLSSFAAGLAFTRNIPGIPTSFDLISTLWHPLVSKTGTDTFTTVFPALLSFGLLKIVTETKVTSYAGFTLRHRAWHRISGEGLDAKSLWRNVNQALQSALKTHRHTHNTQI